MAPGCPAATELFGELAPPLIRRRVSAVDGVSLSVEVEDPTVGKAAQGLAPVRPKLQGVRTGPPELSFLNSKKDFRNL